MSGEPKQTRRVLTLREARELAKIAVSVTDGPSGGDTALEMLVTAALAERGRVEVSAPLAYEVTAWRTTLEDSVQAFGSLAAEAQTDVERQLAKAIGGALLQLLDEVSRRVELLQAEGGAAGVGVADEPAVGK